MSHDQDWVGTVAAQRVWRTLSNPMRDRLTGKNPAVGDVKTTMALRRLGLIDPEGITPWGRWVTHVARPDLYRDATPPPP